MFFYDAEMALHHAFGNVNNSAVGMVSRRLQVKRQKDKHVMAEKEYEELTALLARIEKLVLSGAKEALTLDECSAYTGYSKGHLYRLTSRRAIPFYKPLGGTIFFRKSEIDEWMLQNRQMTQAEINSKAATYCSTRKYK